MSDVESYQEALAAALSRGEAEVAKRRAPRSTKAAVAVALDAGMSEPVDVLLSVLRSRGTDTTELESVPAEALSEALALWPSVKAALRRLNHG